MTKDKEALAEVAEAVEVIEDEQPVTMAPPPDPDAVIVWVAYKDDGNVEVNPQVSGTVRATEMPTLLAAARKVAGQRLGVE